MKRNLRRYGRLAAGFLLACALSPAALAHHGWGAEEATIVGAGMAAGATPGEVVRAGAGGQEATTVVAGGIVATDGAIPIMVGDMAIGEAPTGAVAGAGARRSLTGPSSGWP